MMKVEIASHSAGAVIKIKAHPGARRQGLSGIHDGALKIDVNSAPEKGKANKEIRKILAGVFVWMEVMHSAFMTYLTFSPLHKHMPCMAVRFFQCYRALRHLAHMAFPALLPWFFPAVCLGELFAAAFYHISNKQLILFKNA